MPRKTPARVLLRPLPNHRHASRVGPRLGGSSLADGRRAPPPSSPSRILFIYSETRGGCFRTVSRSLASTEYFLSALCSGSALQGARSTEQRAGPFRVSEAGNRAIIAGWVLQGAQRDNYCLAVGILMARICTLVSADLGFCRRNNQPLEGLIRPAAM